MKYQITHYDAENMIVSYKVATSDTNLRNARVLQSSIEQIYSIEDLEVVIFRSFTATLTPRQRGNFDPLVEQFTIDNVNVVKDLPIPDLPESMVQGSHSDAQDQFGLEPEITLI